MPNQMEMNCDDAHLVLLIPARFWEHSTNIRSRANAANVRTIKNLEIINHGICVIVVSESDVGRWAVQISPT